MKKRLVFRADGNENVGLGHVTRSLALSNMLKQNFECFFAIADPSESVKNLIEKHGVKIVELSDGNDEFLAFLTGKEIVVLDGYYFDLSFQKSIKAKGSILCFIDDLANQEFYVDAIINHAPGIYQSNYKAPVWTQYFLGLEYVLLREVFLEQRDEKADIEKKHVFLCFGGSDPNNLTSRVLDLIWEVKEVKKISIVLGSEYQFKNELIKKINEKNGNVELHSNLNALEMRNLITSSDIAIVPSSGILLEAISQQKSIITGYYVDNQKKIEVAVKNYQGIYSVGNFNDMNKNSFINELTNFTKNNSPKVSNIIDGNSSTRMQKQFLNLSGELDLSFRQAQQQDAKLYFDWANDPLVRQNSLINDAIPWEGHLNWFTQKLDGQDSLLLICEIEGNPAGQVRYDKRTDGEFQINYSMGANFRGKGLARIMVSKSIKELEKLARVTKVYATVKKENIASCKVFENLGFELEDKSLEQNENLNFYIKD